MVDHVVYELQGTTRHTVPFVGDGDTALQDWHLMNREQMQAKKTYMALVRDGFNLFRVEGYGNGDRFAAIWRKN